MVTGVLVGAYGQEEGFCGRNGGACDLAQLLKLLTEVPGIARVRLSSIEPTQVTDRLLDLFAGEPKLCRHLHIPLQSGDSGVLRRMNRPYDREFYLEMCRDALRLIPDLAITADIMVGFPGEDRAAFENTVAVAREVGFARAHIFRYSPRPTTPAAELTNQVPEPEKESRAKELAAACRETQSRFIARYIGRRLEVLVEGKERRQPSADSEEGASGNDGNARVGAEGTPTAGPEILQSGYTSNYIRVRFAGGSHLIGRLAEVQLTEPDIDGAIGECGRAHFGPDERPPDAEFIPLAAFSGTIRSNSSSV